MNLLKTAGGGPSIDSKATVVRRVSVRLAIWPLLTQPDAATPSSRTPTVPKRRCTPTRVARATGRPNPLCIDFPATRQLVEIFQPSRPLSPVPTNDAVLGAAKYPSIGTLGSLAHGSPAPVKAQPL